MLFHISKVTTATTVYFIYTSKCANTDYHCSKDTKHLIYHYSNEVLSISGGIDEPGSIKWSLAACLAMAWFVVFIVLIKGIQSLGKVTAKYKSYSIKSSGSENIIANMLKSNTPFTHKATKWENLWVVDDCICKTVLNSSNHSLTNNIFPNYQLYSIPCISVMTLLYRLYTSPPQFPTSY